MKTREIDRSRAWVVPAMALGLGLLLAGCDWFTGHKKTVPPPNPYPVLDSETALVKTLEIAYSKLDLDKFQSLFPPPENANYLFLLSEVTSGGETSWGVTEEKRIHRRMFQPQKPLLGENPVPPENWLQSVDIALTPETEFFERPDLYRSSSNPAGLDPAKWRATQARYGAYLLFQLAGTTDYQIDARENFVVIEDLTKPGAADPGKWFLYRWQDLPGAVLLAEGAGARDAHPSLGVERPSWGLIKSLYR